MSEQKTPVVPFQSTLSMRRATVTNTRFHGPMIFQSTLSMRRATHDVRHEPYNP